MSWDLFGHRSIQLVCLGIAIKLVCAAVLWRAGRATVYPYATTFLVGKALRSCYLLWCGFHSKTGYYDAWQQSEWLSNLLWALLALEVFLAMARHFPLTEATFGYLAILSGVGLGLGVLTRSGGKFAGPVGVELGKSWVALFACLFVVTTGGLLYRFFADFKLRRNVVVFVPVAGLLILTQLVVHERIRRTGRASAAEQSVIVGATALAAVIWAWRMNRRGDDFTLPPPDPVKLIKGLYALRRVRRELKRVRGVNDDAPLTDHF